MAEFQRRSEKSIFGSKSSKTKKELHREKIIEHFTKSGVSSANLAPFKHSIIMRDDF